MVRFHPRWPLPCALLLVCWFTSAPAQPAAPTRSASQPPSRPDPLDAKARVPAAAYVSPFATYRRLGDDKAVAWREANDALAPTSESQHHHHVETESASQAASPAASAAAAR